jgi:cytoskeletal protein RodZ
MRSVGRYLKDGRIARNYSLEQLAEITKIKKDFLAAIEMQKWDKLPEFPVVNGFVKNFADAVNIDKNFAVSLLRRDYPVEKKPLKPKAEIRGSYGISPRFAFFIGVVVILLGVFGYLAFAYYKFIQPPKLSVSDPREGQVIYENSLVVTGKTNPNAAIRINDLPATVDEDGNFSKRIEINGDSNKVTIKAISRSGKEVSVERSIDVEVK